eukprot:gb/GEZN01002453.1/.p1 GENE.gb/GEZN01002453.1/~~gb/GEZN01002453.1/.p1  ORF type:complete len:773 (-),score=136.25 gb/GEZN01002453.1/:159-2447(-)
MAAEAVLQDLNKLVEEGKHNQTNGPLKMTLFRLGKSLKDDDFQSLFTDLGGTDVLIRIIEESSAGNIVSYAMKDLLLVMCQLRSLEAMANTQDKFARLWGLIYSDKGKVSCHALALLAIICEFAEDGFEKAQVAAQMTSAQYKQAPYQRFAQLFHDEDGQVVVNAVKLANVLFVKSVLTGQRVKLISEFQKYNLVSYIEERKLDILFAGEDRKEWDFFRTALRVSTPLAHIEDDASLAIHAQECMDEVCWFVEAVDTTIQNHQGLNGVGSLAKAMQEMAVLAEQPMRSPQSLVANLKIHLRDLEQQLSSQQAKHDGEVETAAAKEKEMEDLRAQRDKELEVRQARLEQMLVSLQKSATSTPQASQELQSQMEALRKNQEILIEQYHNAKELEDQKAYLKSHAVLWSFYQSTQLKINEMMLAYKVLDSGLVAAEEQNKVISLIALAGENIPLPGVGAAANLINAGLKWRSANKQAKKSRNINDVATSVTEMEKMSEEVARLLAYCYEEQIRMCQPGPCGVIALSHCAVHRILHCIGNGHIDHKSIKESVIEQMVSAPSRDGHKSGTGGLFNKKIKTVQGSSWTESGVFIRSAIRTLDGAYYVGKETRPDKYGYRLGSAKQVHELSLTPSIVRVKSEVSSTPDRSPMLKQYRSKSVQPCMAPVSLFSSVQHAYVSDKVVSSFELQVSEKHVATPSLLKKEAVKPSSLQKSAEKEDMVLVPRSEIDEYETRLQALESRVAEIDQIKAQMNQMQQLLRTLTLTRSV